MVSSKPDLRQVVAAALAEDLGESYVDVTTASIVGTTVPESMPFGIATPATKPIA